MAKKSTVYFLKPEQYRDIPKVMERMGIDKIISKHDFVAIKIHFGEKGNLGHVKPELIKPIIKKIKEFEANVFVTDANTIYRGQRTDAVNHLMTAAEHNFHPKYLGVPVIIADGLRGSCYVEVNISNSSFDKLKMNGLPKHFKKVKIAEAIYNSDAILAISHFKGHGLCGIGGAIKNLGMGCASRHGKYEQHNSVVPKINTLLCTACGACVKWCAGGALSLRSSVVSCQSSAISKSDDRRPTTVIRLDAAKCTGCGQCVLVCSKNVFKIPWNEESAVVQEKIAEYASGVVKGKKTFYINFLTFITSYCDCFKTTGKPIMPDVGILLSADPVAIDQASLDLIKQTAGRDILKDVVGTDGTRQIEYAEKLGLGSREYELKKGG